MSCVESDDIYIVASLAFQAPTAFVKFTLVKTRCYTKFYAIVAYFVMLKKKQENGKYYEDSVSSR